MQEQQQQQQQYSIRDVLTIVFKHKYKMLVTFMLALIVTAVLVYQVPKQYVARAVIMVKFGREFQSIPQVGDERPAMPGQEAIINTEMQILRSRDLISDVLTKIGVEKIYPELATQNLSGQALKEVGILTFSQNIFVNSIKGSNLIEVYYRHDNPRAAAAVLTLLVDSFKEKHLQVFSAVQSPFLGEQLKSYEKKLRESEDKLASFKKRYEVYSLEQQKGLLIGQRAGLDTEIQTTQSRISELNKKLSFLKSQDDIVLEGGASGLRSQLQTAERKEKELLEKYTPKNKMVTDVQREIAMLREQLHKQQEDVRKGQFNQIEAELRPLEVKVGTLKAQLNQVDRDVQAIDFRSREFDDLKREQATNEANYLTYVKRFEEAQISDDMDRRKMTNVNVIEKPSVPIMPVKANTQKIIGMGIFIAFAASFGLAIASEFIPQCFTTPQSAARRLHLPVLAAIAMKK